MTTASPSGLTLFISRSAICVIASSWICGRLMIQSARRKYFDRPIRFECSFGMSPIHSRPMIGQKWWLQALRTVIGPTIISSLRCSAFGNSVTGGAGHVAPAEHLVDVHLRDAPRGVLRVVIAHRVDHEAFEHAPHLVLDFVEQRIELARAQERRDVVVGVEAVPGLLDPRADPGGHRLVGDFIGLSC